MNRLPGATLSSVCRDAWHLAGQGLGLLARAALIALVWSYRLVLRPLFPTTCRFEPSCSEYALQAVRRHGAVRGGWLALKRLGRCNPWGPWGHDPVPEPETVRPHGACHAHSAPAHSALRREHP